MTRAEALRAATEALRRAGCETATQDAVRLLCHATGCSRLALTLERDEPLSDAEADLFKRAVCARKEGRPVAQIIGIRSFYGRDFRVTADTLDPRPETETVIEVARAAPFERVLDLGTGTGCILLTLLAEAAKAGQKAEGLGTDISEAALTVARENAARLALSPRFCPGDWWQALPQDEARFDLITSNPPYIAEAEMAGLAPGLRFEPRQALTPGGDGLDAYRRIAASVGRWLVPGGRVIVEIGPTQAAAVSALFAEAGLTTITVHPDLDGRDRVVSAAL